MVTKMYNGCISLTTINTAAASLTPANYEIYNGDDNSDSSNDLKAEETLHLTVK